MKTMTTINNGNMIKLNDEELEKINGGYILDRGSGCCRYVLIDDITGECYCFANTLSGIKNKEKAAFNWHRSFFAKKTGNHVFQRISGHFQRLREGTVVFFTQYSHTRRCRA